MATSDFEMRRDELERDDLQKIISQVETVLTVSTPGTRGLLEYFLQNAKSRVSSLERKIKEEADKQREEHERKQSAAAAMAERETALNEAERKTFAGFLEKSFFTKKDFPKMEEFYAKSWDRLSQQAKDEMSFRFWQGVRRGAYSYEEAPTSAKEKEMQRAYVHMTQGDSQSRVDLIPEKERSRFIDAYQRGDKRKAEEVLNQRVFADHLSEKSASMPSTASADKADLDLSGIDFSRIAPAQREPALSASEVSKDMDPAKRSR